MNSCLTKRSFLKILALASMTPGMVGALQPFDFSRARSGYLERLAQIKKTNVLPIIDIESSYDPLEINLESFTKSMDRAGIALMCMSVDQPGKLAMKGEFWGHHALEAFEKFPSHFIPTGNGANFPVWTRRPETFLSEHEKFISEHNYPLMGEFEVRHYPSPRQVQRGETIRDLDYPVDGNLMERVFAFAEKTGIPFQIHYEIEDRLIDPLEKMLAKFPKAKVIWCHLAQIRYPQRSTRYNPTFVDGMLKKYPNLYIDTAFGDSLSTYAPSGARHATYWINTKEWSEVIASNPYRFLAALDIGGDRMDKVEEWTRTLRYFLATLPAPAQEIVAYKAAWKLLFNEEL